MGRQVDEFNNYGISNPDGVQGGLTDYTRYSFDIERNQRVKELPTDSVKENSSFDEYPQTRQSAQNNAPQSSSNQNTQQQTSQSNLSDVSSASSSTTAASSSTAASTTAASTTAASTAAASSAAASTVAATVGATVSASVAAAVVTAVMVVTVVANAFSLAVSFLSATFNSLTFNVSIENNEENEEFRAVLYEGEEEAIVGEKTISVSTIVMFDNLKEDTLYTFVVYDKDEIKKFKQTYLTSTRRAYEEDISVEVTSNKNGILNFDLSVPAPIASDVYTLRVKDDGGKELLAVDGTVEKNSFSVEIPLDSDIIISVSFGNRVAYQYRIEKSVIPDSKGGSEGNDNVSPDSEGVPEGNYLDLLESYNISYNSFDKGTMVVRFEDKQDSSIVKFAYGKYSDLSVVTEPEFNANGVAMSNFSFKFDGKSYTLENTERVIPAMINDYSFETFYWEDNGLDEDPSVYIRFVKYDYLTDRPEEPDEYKIDLTPTFVSEATNIYNNEHEKHYEVYYQPCNQLYPYEGAHSTFLRDYYVEFSETYEIDHTTGLAMKQVFVSYQGLENGKEETIEVEPIINERGIFYRFEYRGDQDGDDVVTVAYRDPSDTYYYTTDGVSYFMFNEDKTQVTIDHFDEDFCEIDDETFDIPSHLFGGAVTTISGYAFNHSEKIKTLNVPATVTNYSEACFATMTYLETVNIAGGITDIVPSMFEGCTNFHADTFLNYYHPTTIGAKAFADTNATDTQLNIPQSVETIGEGAFSGLDGINWVTLYFTGASADATGEEKLFGYIFGHSSTSWGTSVTQQFSSNSADTYTCYIPSSLANIRLIMEDVPSYALYGVKSGVTTGIAVATYDVSNSYLSHINTIGESAFESSNIVSFETDDGDGLTATEIKANAFRNASKFKGYGSSENITGNTIGLVNVSKIEEKAFEGTAAQTVSIGEEIQSIGQGAFGKMKSLSYYNTYLIGGTTMGTQDKYEYYFGYVFSSESGDGYDSQVKWQGYTSTSPSTLVTKSYYLSGYMYVTYYGDTIEDRAFYGVSDYVQQLVLTENLTEIGDYAFYNARVGTYGQQLEIPSSVTSIGNYAFAASGLDIIAMRYLTFDMEGDEGLEIGDYAFYMNGAIASIELPNRLTSIGQNALEKCRNLSSYSAPFVGCSVGGTFADLVGTEPAEDSTTHTALTTEVQIYTYVDNEEVIELRAWPAKLTNITITGTNVSNYAFAIFANNGSSRGDTILESVTLTSVQTIGVGAFRWTSIDAISISYDTVKRIEAYAFNEATLPATYEVEEVYYSYAVGDELMYIGELAFQGAVNDSAEQLGIYVPENYNATWTATYFDENAGQDDQTVTRDSLASAITGLSGYILTKNS